MKLPNKEEFNYQDCVIAGDECWLITPKHMGVQWTEENARFRSCVVRQSDGFVISQGYRKFTNLGEKSEFEPWNAEWPICARRKIDGSLLMVSRYKGEMVVRVRNYINAYQLLNGYEISLFEKKYPEIFNWFLSEDTSEQTLLLEWTSPTNIIVLREHEEPTLTLLGIVENTTARYWCQQEVDFMAKYIFLMDRPETYEYASLDDCVADVIKWEDREGVVIYSPDSQILKKVKAGRYADLHAMATGLKTINNVLDWFMRSPRFTTSEGFYSHLESQFDYEVAEKCKPFIEPITDAYAKIVRCIEKAKERAQFIQTYSCRKEQAAAIQQEFTGWKTAMAFLVLDNREIDDKVVRKAMEKILEL
jgi:hypothetical protein